LRHIFGFLLLLHALGYAQNAYDIKVTFNGLATPLAITQNIRWTNDSDVAVKTLYLLDWNHAYSSSRSQLGYFLANEFDYKLIRASKKNQGYTDITEVYRDGQKLKWERQSNKREVIKIHFDDAIAPDSAIDFTVNYSVKLPDAAKFKYGTSNDQLFTYHWHLVLGTLNSDGSWLANTNFGFDKPMSPPAEVRYHFDTNQDFELLLPAQSSTAISPLLLTRRKTYQTLSFGNATLITDMIPVDKTIGLASHLKILRHF
jgi:hypothetical protein